MLPLDWEELLPLWLYRIVFLTCSSWAFEMCKSKLCCILWISKT
ncbi:rCG62820 [Rattus norvegicus]|uniref:RCG62820 n=1 Tax=Rattus norvegicus TaxID=10116 RepID=A6J5J4_RAT|nr:rCG62820 [Rattus norvegicus]